MTDYREIVDTYQDNMTRETVLADKSGRTLLRYPLNKDDVYGGTITFRARKVNYGDLTDSYKKLILEDENFKKITILMQVQILIIVTLHLIKALAIKLIEEQ